MTEEQIKQLQRLQEDITSAQWTLTYLKRPSEIRLDADGNRIYRDKAPRGLHDDVKKLCIEKYESYLLELVRKRDSIVLCTSATKTTYKPVDIMGNE